MSGFEYGGKGEVGKKGLKKGKRQSRDAGGGQVGSGGFQRV